MIFDFIYNFLKKRHFWRYATFSEIAELYASKTTRTVAINIAAGFTSIYLYQVGYSIAFILLFWAIYYLVKIPIFFISTKLVAKRGPKHGVLISNLLYIPAMVSISLVTQIGLLAVVIWGIFTAISTSIYYMSYMVDFSHVKDVNHVGKEIAIMHILEKLAISLSPVLGGAVALVFGPRVLMVVSGLLFLLAALPLMRTSEPIKTNQIINYKSYKHFPWKSSIRGLIAHSATGFDYVTTGVVWGLFVAIVALSGAGNAIYVGLGALSSVTVISAIVTSYAFGKLIDKDQGGRLLKIGVVANALVHFFRPFSITPASIVGINLTNEIATTSYSLPFMRGLFDAADRSGQRLVYLCSTGIASTAGGLIGCLVAMFCVLALGDINGIKIFFFIAALAVLIIGTENFRIYHK